MPVQSSQPSEITLLERPHPDNPSLHGTALSRIRPPASVRVIALFLAIVLPILALITIVVPWQQSAYALGRVVAFAPQEREQHIEAPVSGRLATWFVQEGQRVNAGDPLVEIVDNDPDLFARLTSGQQMANTGREAAADQVQSYAFKLEASLAARDRGVAELEAEVQEALQKRVGEVAELTAANQNLDRVTTLAAEGIVSVRDLELARMSHAKASAALEARDRLVDAKRQKLEKTRAEAEAKVSSARAEYDAARSKVAEAEQKLLDSETKLARQATQIVLAPRSGIVLRLHGGLGGGQTKAGDLLVTLVPETDSRAVELWLKGNDMPFVTDEAEVRVVFEGWPALQFVGLKGASRGTFAGRVAFIDATDDGKGSFRAVIVPADGEEWPDSSVLRQGVRAKGYVLLGQVPLGKEIWRQINGFPPDPAVRKGDTALFPTSKKPRTPSVLK